MRSLALAIPLMSVGAGAAVVGLRHLQLRVPARVFAGSPTFQLADESTAAWQVLPWEQGLMLGGLLLVVLSNLVLIRALYRNLAVERFIVLRADGLVRQVDSHYTHVAWDDVEHVAYDAARDTVVLNVVRGLKSALKYAAIEKLGAEGELAEADAMAVVRKEIKKRQDSVASYEQANRQDLADTEKAEIAVLEKYLPAAMSAEEITKLVEGVIAELGATSKKEMGGVMKALQERVAGRADSKDGISFEAIEGVLRESMQRVRLIIDRLAACYENGCDTGSNPPD